MTPAAADEPGVPPVSKEDVEASEALPSDHYHDGISSDAATLAEHLQSAHQLDLDASVSAATLNGLHDRVHEESHAVDE